MAAITRKHFEIFMRDDIKAAKIEFLGNEVAIFSLPGTDKEANIEFCEEVIEKYIELANKNAE